MTKKELEEQFNHLSEDYAILDSQMTEARNRVWENISYIEQALKVEKNKKMIKLLTGLKQEFRDIYNKLSLNDLPFKKGEEYGNQRT